MITKRLQNSLVQKRTKILHLIFGVLMSMTFTSVNVQAQSTVTLPENTARFYLERHFRASILDSQIDIKKQIIVNLERQLSVKNSIIDSYERDKKLYRSLLSVKDNQQKVLQQDIKTLRKEARKQKFQKKVILIVGVVLLTLTATQ